MSALRSSPHFAPLFAQVFFLCWPILVWQINRFYNWTIREGIRDALYSVNRWGFITIVYLGDRDDPHTYKPIARTFRSLTDASYASDLPTNLVSSDILTAVPILPRLGGGGGSRFWRESEGALRPLMLDST